MFDINRNYKGRRVIAPLLGAIGITLCAVAPSLAGAPPAPSRACVVTFNVTNATALKALQFTVNATAAAPGGFDKTTCGVAGSVPAGLEDYATGTNSLEAGWASNGAAFNGPGAFVNCTYVASDATDPVAGNFTITVTDHSGNTIGVPAVPAPTMAASAVVCSDAAASCGNGVPETGETCDGSANCTDNCSLKGSCPDVALTGCFGGTAGKLSFKNGQKNLADNSKDQAQFQLKKGDATTAADFSDPINGSTVAGHCITATRPPYCITGNTALVPGNPGCNKTVPAKSCSNNINQMCTVNGDCTPPGTCLTNVAPLNQQCCLQDADCDLHVQPKYSFCAYDSEGLVAGVDVASPTGWTAKNTGFSYKPDTVVNGISQITLKAGDAGKSQVSIKAKDKAGTYASPSLPLTDPVTGQLVIDDGTGSKTCFAVTFPTATKNEAKQYSAKK